MTTVSTPLEGKDFSEPGSAVEAGSVNPVVLNKEDVLSAARLAFNEQRLSIQHDPFGGCLYRDRAGHPCVIGAALSDVDAKRFDKRYAANKDPGIRTLIDDGLVTSDDPEFLCALQAAHDESDLAELRGLLFADGAPSGAEQTGSESSSGSEQ